MSCRLLLHRWTGWVPDAREPCAESRECTRCEARQARTRHVWGDQTVPGEIPCEIYFPCQVCDARRLVRESHTYQFAYDQPGRCEGMLRCIGCGEPRSGPRTVHAYEQEYYRDGSCEGQDRCARCGATANPGKVLHPYDWDVRATQDACRTGTCPRCGRVETQSHRYHWVYDTDLTVERDADQAARAAVVARHDHPCLQLRQCRNCARLVPGRHRTSHDWDSISRPHDCKRCGKHEDDSD